MANIKSIQVAPSADGRLRYGDAPAAPSTDVTASSSVTTQNGNDGTPFSLDLTTLFTGTDIGDGTVYFIPSQGSLDALGLSVVDEEITGTPVEGAVSGRARWINDSDPTDRRSTNTFSILIAGALVGNSVVPPQVINVQATSDGETVTIVHDKSSDPHDGTNSGSGIVKYQYFLGDTLIAEEDAADPGLSPAYTSQDIGTLSPAGTSNEVGAGGTDTAEGFIGENTGVAAFLDQFRASRIYPHSGDFVRSFKIESFTGSTSNDAKSGGMARWGLEADDPFVMWEARQGKAIRLEYRAVKGGRRVTLGAGTITGFPCWGRFSLSGSTWKFEISENGNDFTEVATLTLAPPALFYLMRGTCSTADGVVATAVASDDNFWTGSRITKEIETDSAGPFTVRAVGGAGAGAKSAPVYAALPSGGVFPGTTLKFRPGFCIDNDENPTTPAKLESAWQAFYTASPNRKASYRPPGIYGGLIYRRAMKLYYTNQNVRPEDPYDHTDPAYDWSGLDATFAINAVQNEGALIVLNVGVVSWSSTPNLPAWLINAPYDGLFVRTTGGSIPKFYRYTGPDKRGLSNRGTAPGIVDEIVAFVSAMHDHLVATGNIDKVMFVRSFEAEPSGTLPGDYNKDDYYHGMSVCNAACAEIFAASNIIVCQSTLVGSGLDIRWQYMDDPDMGAAFPDVKMNGTDNFTSAGRFTDIRDNTYQKDVRFLAQADEVNGRRATTYFAPGIPNPWGLSGVSVPQTIMHRLWAFCGSPKAADPEKRDSGLGQVGEDPPGLMPAHNFTVLWTPTTGNSPATLADVHQACDTFGPAGTFAFPYLPEGYVP